MSDLGELVSVIAAIFLLGCVPAALCGIAGTFIGIKIGSSETMSNTLKDAEKKRREDMRLLIMKIDSLTYELERKRFV